MRHRRRDQCLTISSECTASTLFIKTSELYSLPCRAADMRAGGYVFMSLTIFGKKEKKKEEEEDGGEKGE